MHTLRLSRGRFNPANADTISKLLDSSQEALIPAIKALPGNIGYYATIDPLLGLMTNTSLWDTPEHAEQMGDLQEMNDLAAIFIAAGVEFERPISNQQVLWAL